MLLDWVLTDWPRADGTMCGSPPSRNRPQHDRRPTHRLENLPMHPPPRRAAPRGPVGSPGGKSGRVQLPPLCPVRKGKAAGLTITDPIASSTGKRVVATAEGPDLSCREHSKSWLSRTLILVANSPALLAGQPPRPWPDRISRWTRTEQTVLPVNKLTTLNSPPISLCVDHAAIRTRRRSRSKPARP